MAKPKIKKYHELNKFPDYYYAFIEKVREHGRIAVQMDSKSELMGERLRLYRYMESLRHFKPSDPVAEFSSRVEIKYSLKTFVMEVMDRGEGAKKLRDAVDLLEIGTYDAPVRDPVADTLANFDDLMAETRAKYKGGK